MVAECLVKGPGISVICLFLVQNYGFKHIRNPGRNTISKLLQGKMGSQSATVDSNIYRSGFTIHTTKTTENRQQYLFNQRSCPTDILNGNLRTELNINRTTHGLYSLCLFLNLEYLHSIMRKSLQMFLTVRKQYNNIHKSRKHNPNNVYISYNYVIHGHR